MKMAVDESKKSVCERLKVGCLIVNGYDIVSKGHNHMPNHSDKCECGDKSCDDVIHAEVDAIQKYAKMNSISSLINSTIFITHSPCIKCAHTMLYIKPKAIYYLDKYRDCSGIEIIKNSGVHISQIFIDYHH
jgi:dCMP deaminase